MHWYTDVMKNYAGFSGRARRKEYWMFVLINFIISIVLAVVEAAANITFLSLIYSLVILVPSIALTTRRLHDTGRNGWWQLIALIPLIGGIILIIFAAQDSQPGENEYGPNPKEFTQK